MAVDRLDIIPTDRDWQTVVLPEIKPVVVFGDVVETVWNWGSGEHGEADQEVQTLLEVINVIINYAYFDEFRKFTILLFLFIYYIFGIINISKNF